MEYQKTSIGEIPVDWELVKIENLLDFLTDYEANGSFSNLKKNTVTYNDKNYAWFVRATDLENNRSPETSKKIKYIDRKSYEFLSKTKLYGGEFLVTKRGEIGKVYLMPNFQGYASLAPNLYLLKLNSRILSKFIYYYFSSAFGSSWLVRANKSSTMGALYKDDVKTIKIPLPTIQEQQKITEILSTVDQAIQKSDEIIAKTECLKKGMMQKLLTEGISHEEFQDTPIGRIPENWKLISLSKIIEVQGGYAFKSKDYTNTGIPLIRIANVSFGKVLFEDLAKVPDLYLEKYHDFSLKPGDVVMALTRPIIGGGIKAGQIDEIHTPSLLNQRVGRLRILDDSLVSYQFLFWTIFSENFVNQMKKGLVTMNQPNISPKQIGEFKIPLPSKNEQENIASIITDIDKKYQFEFKRNLKLKNIKKGLMNDLLTGKKRVKLDS